MAFVNVLLLFGILAVSIPIIIQLLTRRHTRKIMWGAMVFLQAAMNKRKRKVLLEDILLLACRCLLPALAALALARPFVTPGSRVPWVIVLPMMLLAITLFGISFAMWRYPKWRRLSMALSIVLAALSAAAVLLERKLNLSRFGGGANKDVALIVDGSSSMSMTGSDGKSNFENAIEEAGKYIEGASRGTAFSLILGGPVPEILTPVPVSDRRVLLDTLKRMRPSQGTMRAPPALAAAAVTLAAGNNTVKQVIVAGDGQTVGWDLTSEGRWESIKALFGQLRTPPPVVWRTLPLPASIRNLAVSSVTLSREVVGADREVKVRVTVSNPGTEAVTPGGVSLSIGPKVLKAKDARQLEPGDSQTFEFPHTFEKPGAAVLTATVEAGDDLPEDDTFRLVVPVLDKLRVLVVDGDGSGSPLSRGSTYLSLALRPELAGKGISGAAAADSSAAKAGYLLETVVEDVARAAARTDFSAFAAVALCNVPRLSDATLASLANYVRDGGGLLLLSGIIFVVFGDAQTRLFIVQRVLPGSPLAAVFGQRGAAARAVGQVSGVPRAALGTSHGDQTSDQTSLYHSSRTGKSPAFESGGGAGERFCGADPALRKVSLCARLTPPSRRRSDKWITSERISWEGGTPGFRASSTLPDGRWSSSSACTRC